MSGVKPLPVRAPRLIATLWWALTNPPADFARIVAAALPDAPMRGLDVVRALPSTGARWVGESSFVVDAPDDLARVLFWDAEPHEAAGVDALKGELAYWGFERALVDGAAVWSHAQLARNSLERSCAIRPPPTGALVDPHTPAPRLAP